MPMIMGAYPDLYDSLLANLITVIHMKREIAIEGMQFYNVQTGIKDLFVQETTMSGFGDVPVKEEYDSTSSDVFYQGFDKKYQGEVRSLMYSVSKEAAMYNKWINMRKNVTAFERSFRSTKEVKLAEPINLGHSTFTSADGLSFFNTGHYLLPSGTQKNTMTTAADLSVTSLQTAINDYADTTDYRGHRLNLKPGRLLVPTELQWLGWELLNSAGRPDTANRADNAIKGLHNMVLAVWGYLTDEDAWGLLPARNEDHGLNYKEWESFDTYIDYDFDRDAIKVKARESYDIDITEWEGCYHVPGG